MGLNKCNYQALNEDLSQKIKDRISKKPQIYRTNIISSQDKLKIYTMTLVVYSLFASYYHFQDKPDIIANPVKKT